MLSHFPLFCLTCLYSSMKTFWRVKSCRQFLNDTLIPFCFHPFLRFNHSSAWTLPDISICLAISPHFPFCLFFFLGFQASSSSSKIDDAPIFLTVEWDYIFLNLNYFSIAISYYKFTFKKWIKKPGNFDCQPWMNLRWIRAQPWMSPAIWRASNETVDRHYFYPYRKRPTFGWSRQ